MNVLLLLLLLLLLSACTTYGTDDKNLSWQQKATPETFFYKTVIQRRLLTSSLRVLCNCYT